MKIFGIYAKVDLYGKPDWLDNFISKYSKPFDVHITLKQPCYIGEPQVLPIKNSVSNFFENNKLKKIKMTFNTYSMDHSPSSGKSNNHIMVLTKNKDIIKIQKAIVALLNEYTDYCDPITEQYEVNFEPHITIGVDLDNQRYERALTELPPDISIKGEVAEVVLVVANPEDKKVEEEHKTIYKLR
ncbi:MAG: hypothetical protein PHW75_02175 [Patescibacteria group bacterium]|nr:hypothetical protein [Patescibacteria group bacterium]